MFRRLLLTLLVPPLGWLLSSLFTLLVNYARARKLGLPIIVVPISPTNPLWMIGARFVIPILKRLPFGSGHFTRFGYTGWEYKDRIRVHLELGDAFVLVTPGTNWFYLCDADAVSDIICRERRHEFYRPVELLAMLDVFGPNISTVDGTDWQRQRKCTAATFNERNNRIVWFESLQQSREMLQTWTSPASRGVDCTADDARTLALHVLLAAGFGKSYPFSSSTKGSPCGPLNYRESLGMILENAILILALGPKLLSCITFPRHLARLGEATITFQRYMAEMLEDEKRLMAEGKSGADNLMNSLVRAAADDSHDQKQSGLRKDEIFGNMFVFNFAGHDTTAHTLAYTVVFLAVHPEIQDWIAEELHHVFPDEDETTWNYDDSHRLNRTLSVLYETVRLFDPLMSINKVNQESPTALSVGERDVVLPPRTRIILNLAALHTHPRYWGGDALEWRPQRWIKTMPGEGPTIDREVMITPPKGSYLPWGEGARACPGKRFAQVEHVAVMMGLFRNHRVVPVRQLGEDECAARKRVQEVIDDSGMVLLMQMLHPEKAVLEWKQR